MKITRENAAHAWALLSFKRLEDPGYQPASEDIGSLLTLAAHRSGFDPEAGWDGRSPQNVWTDVYGLSLTLKLTGVHLSGVALRGANLQGADLSRSALPRADLRDADLTRANLRSTDLTDANLRRARLEGAHISYARLHGTRFDEADLTDVDLRTVSIGRARFHGATGLPNWVTWSLSKKGTPFQRRALIEAIRTFASNHEQLDLRRSKLKAAWLPGVDLSNALLDEADLSRACLEGADLSGAQLKYARFKAANLRGADLTGAQLALADFNGADLTGARFGFEDGLAPLNSLECARLIDAQGLPPWIHLGLDEQGRLRRGLLAERIQRTHMRELPGLSVTDFELRGARLPGTQMPDAHLAGARLMGAHLQGVNLNGANLTWAHLQGAELSQADLCGARLNNANLQGATCRRTQLMGASLSFAKLQGADFTDADLEGAQVHAWLNGASLMYANLKGVNFSHSDLQGARLHRADLTGADLSKVKHLEPGALQGAHLGGALLPKDFPN
ncbi:MAG: pentapeptide repeat-containing protein [Bradymonadia bacterium]